LLHKVMASGKVAVRCRTLEEIRDNFMAEFKRLPDPIKAIRNPASYPIEISSQLTKLREEVGRQLGGPE